MSEPHRTPAEDAPQLKWHAVGEGSAWADHCEYRRRKYGAGEPTSRTKPIDCGLLTQSDVARLLGLTPVKICKAIKSGKIDKPSAPAPPPPSRYYFAEELPCLAAKLGVDPALGEGSVAQILRRLADRG